jgi:hypothetical protein
MGTENYSIANLMETLEELRSSLPIDKFELEDECVGQATLYDKIGELAIIAKAMARTAKNDLEFLEAETKNKVRKDPESFGIKADKKPTNDAIADAVTVQEDIREAKADYIEKSQLADAFSVLQNATEQRKGNIRNLVTLYVHNYYLAQNPEMKREQKQLTDDYEQEIASQRQREIDSQARG